MKFANNLSLRTRSTGLALALAAFGPALFADEPARAAEKAGDRAADSAASKIEDYRSNTSEMNKAEIKAAFAQIDAELKHLDNLADAAPTPEQKADIKARYADLKQRRKELKKEFTRARYEAFKTELQAAKDRVAVWGKETFSAKPTTSVAVATKLSVDDAAGKISDYRENSSDVNKAEVKASLERLDADIDLLEAKIDAVADPVRKEELKVKLKALKDRRSELNSDFRQARYDALVDDVKAEWNRLVH